MLDHAVVFSSDLLQGTGLWVCWYLELEFGTKKVYQNVNQIKVKYLEIEANQVMPTFFLIWQENKENVSFLSVILMFWHSALLISV